MIKRFDNCITAQGLFGSLKFQIMDVKPNKSHALPEERAQVDSHVGKIRGKEAKLLSKTKEGSDVRHTSRGGKVLDGKKLVGISSKTITTNHEASKLEGGPHSILAKDNLMPALRQGMWTSMTCSTRISIEGA